MPLAGVVSITRSSHGLWLTVRTMKHAPTLGVSRVALTFGPGIVPASHSSIQIMAERDGSAGVNPEG